MGKLARSVVIAVGAVVVLVVLVAVCLPLFLNADNFRTRIESTLTKSLGRKVSIAKLDLSVWSGGLVATNATVADDPAFSTGPFIQAESVKIGVEILPLILSKQIHIRGFALVSPRVQLLRAGEWYMELLHHREVGAYGAGRGDQAGLPRPDRRTGDRAKRAVYGRHAELRRITRERTGAGV